MRAALSRASRSPSDRCRTSRTAARVPPLFPAAATLTDVIHASRPAGHDGGRFDQSTPPGTVCAASRNATSDCRQTHGPARQSRRHAEHEFIDDQRSRHVRTLVRLHRGRPCAPRAAAVPVDGARPFEVARWSVAPNTSNDLDVHRSREVWIIVSGTGTLTFADQTDVLRAGDVAAFDSRVPHQIRNDGPDPLLAISVYWLPDSD
ncbi:cupin domain-containing protein [Micromonospora sp. M12]